MKYITLKLSIAVILFSNILWSCKEDESVTREQIPQITNSGTYTTNPLDSLGLQHNELVDYYKSVYQMNVSNRFFYYDSTSYITMECYNNIIQCARDYMTNPLYYNSAEVDNVIDSIYNIFNDLNLFVTINGVEYFKIIKDYKNILEYSHNKGYISNQTYTTISPLFIPLSGNNLGISCDIENKLSQIELSQSPNWANLEIANFVSIYRHSQAFWDSSIVTLKDTNYPMPCGMNPNQALIAADAAGGLMGLTLGGAGSVILAGIASACEAEDQENHCSVLVGSEYPESIWYKKKRK